MGAIKIMVSNLLLTYLNIRLGEWVPKNELKALFIFAPADTSKAEKRKIF